MVRFTCILLLFIQSIFSQNNIPNSLLEKHLDSIVDQSVLSKIQSNYSFDIDERLITKPTFSTIHDEGKRALINAPDLYDNVKESVVLIVTNDGASGSGSILDKSGHIITNFHVISDQDASDIRCILWDESFGSIDDISKSDLLKVKIVGIDETKDLALLKVDTSPSYLKPMPLGQAFSIKIAQDVFAVGHPSGLLWYYTNGTINRVAKNNWNYGDGYSVSANTIYTQTPINPGNSGGPLLDEKGRMIGVNSASSVKMQNVNLAVRIDEVKRFFRAAKNGEYKIDTGTSKTTPLRDAKWKDLGDKNNNGVIDTFVRRGVLDNGKYITQVGVDENEDDIFEYILCDTNEDNKEDLIMYDRKGDGNYSYWEVDSDFDGKVDWEGETG